MKKNRKGHYAKNIKSTDREVMSYEDAPLEDYEQEKTEISPEAVKKIIIGVCVALILGLAVFAIANRDKLTPENISVWWSYDVLGTAGKGYPVNIVGSEVSSGNFAVNQERVAYASDTSFITLNSSGAEVANVQLRYSRPVMKSAENRFLTYGIGDTSYQIQSYDKNIFSGNADASIFLGDIAPNGVYCLVTEGNGYLSELYAYDSNNNRIFKYSFSEYYINSVALKSDGSGCVACGITGDGGEMKTGVYLLDFGKSEPIGKYEIKDDYILDCKFIGSRRAALVGKSNSYIVKQGEDKLINVDYEGKLLTNYCFNSDTGTFALALSKSGDGRSCDLICYNDGGSAVGTVSTSYGAESLSIYKGSIAALDGNTVYVYNNSGELTCSCYSGIGSRKVVLTSDSTAYILSVNQIRFLDLKDSSTDDSAVN